MSQGAGEAFPTWAAPYLPYFESILHAIELIDGFALMPIQVPGPDLARVLGSWLDARGRPTRLISLRDGMDWSLVSAKLFHATVEASGVVMVIGTSVDEPQMNHGLRLLNQRRDSIARRLGRPLLWCGGRSVLDATWRYAPDLWSIAEVPRFLPALSDVKRPPHQRGNRSWTMSKAWSGKSVAELWELFEDAKASGDRRHAVSFGFSLVDALALQAQFNAARQVALQVREMAEALPPRKDLEHEKGAHFARACVLLGQLSAAMGALAEGEQELVEALSLESTKGILKADALEALGEILARTGRPVPAKRLLVEALDLYGQTADKHKIARARLAFGEVAWQLGRLEAAESSLGDALACYRAVGHRRGEARALLSRGWLSMQLTRFDAAETSFREALSLASAADDAIGEASAREGLGELALLRQNPREAFGQFVRSFTIRAAIADASGVAGIHADLARAAMAAGCPLQAAVLAGRALSGLAEPERHADRWSSLTDLSEALDALDDPAGTSALLLAWRCAASDALPDAAPLAERLGGRIPGWTMASPLSPDVIAAHEQRLAEALSACEARLRDTGADPYVLPEPPDREATLPEPPELEETLERARGRSDLG
jgi:tetratricopeptide (TPR) repeat protein